MRPQNADLRSPEDFHGTPGAGLREFFGKLGASSRFFGGAYSYMSCRRTSSRKLSVVNLLKSAEVAALTLLASPTVSDGFAALWQCGRLDLTVEALVLRPPWSALFTEQELTTARKRLTELGYNAS